MIKVNTIELNGKKRVNVQTFSKFPGKCCMCQKKYLKGDLIYFNINTKKASHPMCGG